MAATERSDASPRDIDSQEFQRFMTANEDGARPIVLDVRTPEEFTELRIPGSILIDINSPRFPEEIERLDRDAVYLVYCRSGNRSWTACTYMAGLGFSKLYNLDNGIISWDGPTESGAASGLVE